MNSDGIVVTPDVGRFVCESDSSLERIKEVSSVWRAYYCALALGSGARTNEHDCARIATFGQGFDCCNYLAGHVGGCCGRSVAVGLSGFVGRHGKLLEESDSCKRDSTVCESYGMGRGVREVYNDVGGEDGLSLNGHGLKEEFLESDNPSCEKCGCSKGKTEGFVDDVAFKDLSSYDKSSPIVADIIDSQFYGKDVDNSSFGKVESSASPVVTGCFPETKTERNRRWRKEKKALKERRQVMNQDWRKKSGSSVSSSPAGKSTFEEDVLLQSSLKAKWRIQNELAVERARRELEVLKASDIEQEKKRYRTKISAATERNMVSIEKTHATLRQTGNLPEEQGGGFAETIVGGGTISPDSSASMAEYRACQKALLDAEKALLEERQKLQVVKDRFGIPVDFLDTIDKETWTIGDHNEAALDAWYPNGYGINTMCSPEGKFHAIKV